MKISKLLDLPQESAAMKTHYLLYCRKSSESEDRQCASIESQLEVLRQLATKEKLPILQEFTESHSAKAPGRIRFNEMVKLIQKKDSVKGILCWDTSRLFRNPVDEGIIRWLLDQGKIEELKTPFKTFNRQDSSLLLAVEGGKNQSFIQDLKRNTKRGIDKKLEMGMFPGLAPVGYLNDKTKNQGERDIIQHPVYFDLMREIFKLALSGKYPATKLVEIARKMGIRNSRGQAISTSRMYELLSNPFYCGKFLYAGKLYQGIHPPLLSVREFDSLQDALNGKGYQTSKTQDFTFKSLVKCAYCGYGICGERHTKKSGLIFDYYACVGKKKGFCKQGFIPAQELESQVYRFLGGLKLSSKFVDWAAKWLKQEELSDRDVRTSKYKALKQEHTLTESKLNNLTDKWLEGLLSNNEYQDHKQRFLQRLYEIDEQLKNQTEDWELWTNLTLETFKFASQAQKKWGHGTIEDKKTILRVIGANLILKDKILKIEPKTPFLLISKALTAQKAQKGGENQLSAESMGDFQIPSFLGG